MTAEKFAEFVNAIRPNSDSVVAVWLEWADELEEYDSSHGEKPAGSYKTSGMSLRRNFRISGNCMVTMWREK